VKRNKSDAAADDQLGSTITSIFELYDLFIIFSFAINIDERLTQIVIHLLFGGAFIRANDASKTIVVRSNPI